jgi:outer membrane protein TolC
MKIWLMNMLMLLVWQTRADTLTLFQCHSLAVDASPLQRQVKLRNLSQELELNNLSTSYLPKVGINGQFSYQSDVFTFPFENPNVNSPEIPRDQYRFTLDLNQKIFDGGKIKYQKLQLENRVEADLHQVEADLHQVKTIVNQYFFNLVLIAQNQQVLHNVLQDLQVRHELLQNQVEQGLVLPAAEEKIYKEILNTEQKQLQLEYDKLAALKMLSAWIGRDLNEAVVLQVPEIEMKNPTPELNRPEQKAFLARIQSLETNEKLLQTRILPVISAFAQGGVGRPNPFNFFRTDHLEPFYQAGVRMNWNLVNWGNIKRSRQNLELQQEIILTQKENFERNIEVALLRDQLQLEKLEALIQKDLEIIEVQEKVVNQVSAQLENGVTTSSDYLMEINLLTNAQIQLQIHRLELIQRKADILTQSGIY